MKKDKLNGKQIETDWNPRHPEIGRLAGMVRIPCSSDNLRTGPLSQALFSDASNDADWAASALSDFTIPDQTGGVNPGDRKALYYLVLFFKPASVLEIGTHIGASTTHIALAMMKYGRGHLATVDIVDVNNPVTQPWTKYGASHSPQQMIKLLGCERLVDFCQSEGSHFLQHTRETYDMIFLDGDHHAVPTYQELALALGRLNSGGIIVLHDYYQNMKPLWKQSPPIAGPFLAAQRIKEECPTVHVQPLVSLPWPTKLNTNLTSLAIVMRRKN